MPSNDPSGSTRRRFLHIVGAGVTTTALAGCVADSGESGRDSAVGHPASRTPESEDTDGSNSSTEPYRPLENGLHWHDTPVSFAVGTGTYPDDLDPDAVENAIRRSFDTWNEVPETDPVFGEMQRDPTLESITFENGVNEIVWEEMPDDSLGRAHWRWASNTNRLLEVDIRLNPDREWFVDDSATIDNAYDIQSVVTHELGHNALLDIYSAPQQTMFHETKPGKTKKRTLEEGDIAGWQDAYGDPEN